MSDPAVTPSVSGGKGKSPTPSAGNGGNGTGSSAAAVAPAPVTPPRVATSGNSRDAGRRDGGTQLGMAGFVPEAVGSVWFTGTNDDGQVLRVNAFETVFTDGRVGAEEFEAILNYLEHSGNLDFSGFIKDIEYQGFDRLVYIRAALRRVTVSQFSRFAIMGAVRGSNFKRIRETSINVPNDLSTLVDSGIILKKAIKREDLTILRFTASIPHWVSFWLFKVGFAKKIEAEDCPGWLQYPGAASLPMSKKLRIQHIKFCKSFSALLPGGTFNANIYMTAFKNSIPEKDVPSMLKDQLGIGATKEAQMSIQDLTSEMGSELVKRA